MEDLIKESPSSNPSPGSDACSDCGSKPGSDSASGSGSGVKPGSDSASGSDSGVKTPSASGAGPESSSGSGAGSDSGPARGRTAGRVLRCLMTAVLVLVLGCGMLLGASYVLMPKDNSKEAGMINPKANGFLAEPSNSLDVLFVGDSEAYSSFSPLDMWNRHGFTSYVCSSPAQKTSYSFVLLRRALQGQSPKVVVFETNSFFKKVSINEVAVNALSEVFPVFEYHDRWKSITANDLIGPAQYTWKDSLKGFRYSFKIKKADASSWMAESSRVASIPGINKTIISLMVDYCREHGATPVFMSVPSTKNWNSERHNAVEGLAQELGVDYVDLNKGDAKVDIDWSADSRDAGDHLNYVGASKVSKVVGKLLDERYDLPDHRTESEYNSWNEAYIAFQKSLKSAKKG
ncbi:MAG TPA: hypothetical protein K8U77_08225 [Slackia equolifaciens]|uniref:SGNH/GDSL hydrolase family protein n=1 Tax=Slackia equolifaciens TaxID=498718 RepID=A0A9D2UY72_9ACTN|nr:hypothetical protein [Slackia equolifaciens]